MSARVRVYTPELHNLQSMFSSAFYVPYFCCRDTAIGTRQHGPLFQEFAGVIEDLCSVVLLLITKFCAELLKDWDNTRMLLAHQANIDIVNAGGRQPFQELEVLKSFRKPPLHDVHAANRAKFGHERFMLIVDGRYQAGKALM